MTLAESVEFDDTTRPVCFPTNAAQSYEGEPATATGYGIMDDGSFPNILMEVNVTIISIEECADTHYGVTE